jgi:hypothetical protein
MDQKARQTRGKQNNDMFTATCNVRSLYQSGASRKFEEELEK